MDTNWLLLWHCVKVVYECTVPYGRLLTPRYPQAAKKKDFNPINIKTDSQELNHQLQQDYLH